MERNRGKQSLGERSRVQKMRFPGTAVMVPVHFNCHHFFSLFMLILGCGLLFGVNSNGHKII